jgi:hypothetical protein
MRRSLVALVAFAAAAAPGLNNASALTGGSRQVASVPNFSGVWAHPSIPGFEPLATGPTSLRNLSRREGGVSDNRELVGDYTNPILKPAAAAIVRSDGQLSLAGRDYPNPRTQCWPGGVPFVFTTDAIEFLQQPDTITIIYSTDDQVRHVRLNEPHPKRVTPSWYGDSVGHFEGDTLVVDTVGVKVGPFAMVDWFGTPQSPALHLVERYSLLDYQQAKDGLARDAKENFQVQRDSVDRSYRGKFLQLTFTVQDSNVFTTPWSATMTYQPRATEWLEDVCAENPNRYGTDNEPAIPTATKSDF